MPKAHLVQKSSQQKIKKNPSSTVVFSRGFCVYSVITHPANIITRGRVAVVRIEVSPTVCDAYAGSIS